MNVLQSTSVSHSKQAPYFNGFNNKSSNYDLQFMLFLIEKVYINKNFYEELNI